MSKTQSASVKPRQPKLRASCDGCFLAKVKCSKDRPICSRCLTTGAECGYSPSCRTGKSKASQAAANQSSPDTSPNGTFAEIPGDSAITYTSLNSDLTTYSAESPPYGIHPGWVAMQNQGPVDSRLHRRSISTSSITGLREETIPENVSVGGGSNHGEVFEPFPQWSNGNMRGNGHSSNGFHPMPRSKSIDVPVFPSIEPWFDGQNEMFSFPSNPANQQQFQKNSYPGMDMMGSTCNCFSISLQALQALHNHTSTNTPLPSFDVVLTVNRRAVEGCALMLDCSKCLSGTNSNTTMMLLATIIGKVVSFYRAASQHYFGFTSSPSTQYQPQQLPLTFGTYKIAEEDGRWLEMEILLRELRKLEEVLGKFQDVAGREEMSEHGGVQSAVLSYLRQSLSVTFEVLNMRRGMQGGSR
ncbi:hypothetical protein B0J14DRAFT_477016 [Halenospora varia]|nr:hypothetical protein B0J14DRAFT_477016 [Halenospora varia]